MKFHLKEIPQKLLNEEENKRVVALCTYLVLGVVAFVMTVLNAITDKGLLTWCTGLFAVFSIINTLLVLYGKTVGETIASILFSADILAMFTFFLVSGNPDGFSAIWICLLPSLGMFYFGKRRGSIVSGIMLAIMIFLLWIPSGVDLLMYDYTATFRMRFPILYCSFWILALFLEIVRYYTYGEMKKSQRLYQELSLHDSMTGLFNRQGFYSEVAASKKSDQQGNVNVVILDIDFFKQVNDTYGHDAGDLVLRELTALIKTNISALLCRWGGEEFLFFGFNDSLSQEKLEAFRSLMENHVFHYENNEIRLTVSMGVYETADVDVREIDQWIKKADHALYTAKNSGRNQIVHFSD